MRILLCLKTHTHFVPTDPQVQSHELIAQICQHINCNFGNIWGVVVQHIFCEFHRAANSLGNHNSKFGEQTAQQIADLSALANDEITRAMKEQNALLLFRFDRNKPHGRACHGFADRFGIGGIRFAALDVRLHVIGRDQTDVMPECAQLARPLVARTASFHSYQTSWKVFKESQKLRPPYRAIENNIATFSDAMDLKDVLGEIYANCCNLHWVAPLIAVMTTALWRIATPVGAGAIHPIRFDEPHRGNRYVGSTAGLGRKAHSPCLFAAKGLSSQHFCKYDLPLEPSTKPHRPHHWDAVLWPPHSTAVPG
ncbi:hypothetical protein SAMN05443551_3235 [Marivita hallyeonensis]|uniref:Uncharacterized protein n=1 Tax=Marivita hallyeonensis TaxID=996342 RepID=A0A1M5W380_9RHOB|nr:hypothetical protein SAMN05443551_3235 [Marivita hallyeonensis]